MDFQKLFHFEEPKIMAIINLTPDSFFSGSRVQNEKELLEKVDCAIKNGADWLDLGAVSTRPGSQEVDYQEERNRIMPALELLVKHFPQIPISIDTYRHEIAIEAFDKGAHIINDVSHGQDEQLIHFCAEKNIPYILMHLRGTPNDMMQNTRYNHLITDVFAELQAKMHALRAAGMKRIVIDPGFGFSKNLDQNYQLINHLDYFQNLEAPILVGISRKSMIYKLLDCDADDALNGSTVLHTIALLKGAKILRVHDVKAADECRKLLKKLNESK